MAYQIEVIKPLKLIVIKLRGSMTCVERSKVLDETLELVDDSIFARILVDLRESSPAETDRFADINAFARRLVDEVRLRTCRVAHLMSDAPLPAVQQLLEARGCRIRRFERMPDALLYLMASRQRTRNS